VALYGARRGNFLLSMVYCLNRFIWVDLKIENKNYDG
jgi:hypothetical protein